MKAREASEAALLAMLVGPSCVWVVAGDTIGLVAPVQGSCAGEAGGTAEWGPVPAFGDGRDGTISPLSTVSARNHSD